jgi:FMNH2-dependent dimethyl sulfone monooxygenase
MSIDPHLSPSRPVSGRRLPGTHPFKLGLFSFNTGGGLTHTLAPERWDASWPNMRRLARDAEDAGLEFVLPLAGWKGNMGEAESDGYFHETMAWAAGLLEATQKIHVFATLHVPFINPVFAAKQAVTCDHIGSGRLGLNLVAGFNIAEFDMMGVEYRAHDARYAYLDEWLTVVRRLWTESVPFDHHGEVFDLRGLVGIPKPYGAELPMVVSAGSSLTGREFALNNADALFMLVTDIDTIADELRSIRASMPNREINIFCSGHIICRRTAKETQSYYDYLLHEHGDWAAGRYLQKSYEEIKSVPLEIVRSPAFLNRMMSGSGTLPVVGDPDEVVATLSRLHAAGINGMAFALPDYIKDFGLFREEVIPRLIDAGLRTGE